MHPTRPSSIYSCWVAFEMMIFSLLVLVSPMYERKSDWENHHKSVNHALCYPCQPWAGEKKAADLQIYNFMWSGCKSGSRSQGQLGDVAAILIPWKVGESNLSEWKIFPFFQLPLELQYAVSLERCLFPTKFRKKEYQNINPSGMYLPWIRPSQLNSLL